MKPYPFRALPGVRLVSPAPKQVFQRDAVGYRQGHADIPVVGVYTGAVDAVFGRYDNGYDGYGAWQLLDDAPEGGHFAGTLPGCPAGQGSFQVRIGSTGIVYTVPRVGVGDNFLCTGQSNNSARADQMQRYLHASLMACLFGNSYQYQELIDPYDSATGQLDAVSSDAGLAGGSWHQHLATFLMAQEGVPVCFYPCAKGGSAIAAWQPGVNPTDRSLLHGSACYRGLMAGNGAPGGILCNLWWQGETDARNGVSQTTYTPLLGNVLDGFWSVLACPTMVFSLINSSGTADALEDAIRASIADVVANHPHALAGPLLSDIGSDDSDHVRTNPKVLLVAQRAFDCLNATIYA